MKDFCITYKRSIFFPVLGSIVMLPILGGLFLMANWSAGGSAIEWWGYFGLASLVFLWVWLCTFLVIRSNRRHYKIIAFRNGKLLFPTSPFTDEVMEVDVDSIARAEVMESKHIVRKHLRFYVSSRKFVFSEDHFTQQDFSRFCNALVKRSDRCKACQSTKVAWSGSTGHCYNCETVTPVNSEDFDWKDAYQA